MGYRQRDPPDLTALHDVIIAAEMKNQIMTQLRQKYEKILPCNFENQLDMPNVTEFDHAHPSSLILTDHRIESSNEALRSVPIAPKNVTLKEIY